MQDVLLKAMLCEHAVNLYAISGKELVETARVMHNTSPTCTAALGRALMGTSMLGVMMGFDGDEVSLILKGNGSAGSIVCVGRKDGSVKGYVSHPEADLPIREDGKLDVGGIVGHEGQLTIIRDIGLKEPYVGQSDLVSGEVAEDIAAYFMQSEQQPSVVYLGVLVSTDWSVGAACGVILQPLPFCPEKVLDKLERRVPMLSEFCALVDGGMELKTALEWLFGDMDIEYTEEMKPEFRCDCNRNRLEKVLISLGQEELTDMIEKEQGAHVTCHFCSQDYSFGENELRTLLDQALQK